MGGCSGKKGLKSHATAPTIRGANSSSKLWVNGQDLVELRKLYEEEGGFMNRKVKACFEVVFEGNASSTIEINMKFISLGESGALHLSKVLPCFANLLYLRLWKTKLGIEGAKLLGAVLPRVPQLEILSLEDNEIKTEGASYIAKSLPQLEVLKELYLHVNKMGQEGIAALGQAIMKKDNLEVLTIDENHIGKPGLLLLLSSLSLTLSKLNLLGLSFNQLGDDGARELLSFFKLMPALTKLTLSGNNITPQLEEELTNAAPTVNFLF